MSNHTPGPWEVGPMHASVRPANITSRTDNPNDGCAICALYGKQDRPANARLIAAAPDLAAALDGALGWMSSLEDWSGAGDPDLDAWAAALAKARGEG